MTFEEQSLDDLLHCVYDVILKDGVDIQASRGHTREITAVTLKIQNPRARLSVAESRARPLSCLGELLWYLSGSNALTFISYYISKYDEESEDGYTLTGAYGPRLLNYRGEHNQLSDIIALLKERPTTRRAVIQLYDASDARRRDVPCTCTLQFLVRDDALQLIVNMRSNDAWKGLPHDAFCFTMLQEIVARSLGCELGAYIHFVGSLHLYSDQLDAVKGYLNEGVQSVQAMPPMPMGDPWPNIKIILGYEEALRINENPQQPFLGVSDYWSDLASMLEIHRLRNQKEHKQVQDMIALLKHNAYRKLLHRYG